MVQGQTRRTSSQPRKPVSAQFFDGTYFSAGTGAGKDGIAGRSLNNRLLEYSVPAWRYLYNATLVALDLLMAILATVIVSSCSPKAYDYLIQVTERSWGGVMGFMALVCSAWLISLLVVRSYARHTMGEGYELYSKLFNAACLDFVMLCTLVYLFHIDIPRSLNVLIPIVTLLLTILERYAMRRMLQRNRTNGEYNYATLIVGSPEGIHRTIEQLDRHRPLGYEPIAVCPVAVTDDDAPNERANGQTYAAKSEAPNAEALQHLVSCAFEPANEREERLRILTLDSHLPQTAKRLGVHTVLIADVLSSSSETMRALSLAVESMGMELALTASVADLSGASLHLRDNPSMPVISARLTQYSTATRIIKRTLDILLSSLAIIVSSPIMLWVAYKVKREDGGPIFYSQKRIGLYGKPFTMYKFRSMRTDADRVKAQLAKERGIEGRFLFKLKDDPRITKIGHFIRKTSLDEFPQFFNVFLGNMSLVGPRPPLPEEVEQYNPLYSTRLLVKPGITGPWQISGRSDLTREQSEFADVSYIQHWSITGDLAILLKTVSAVIKGTGSY